MNFTSILTHWYSIHKRALPWRKTKNPYYIWLSEVIMQQTQVKQGLPYYEVFINTFPTVFDLAKADESQVLKLWQGLGYYSRARNLHASAKYISEALNGAFPNNYLELLKLKGVGDYTASAIASICFNEATAVVDGNVYRVLSRFFGVETPINSTKGIKEFKALATKLIDENNPGDYNQAIMEFGAVQCKPKSPNCEICPLKNACLANKHNTISELPIKLKKVKVTNKHFNFLVFLSSEGNTYFEQRTFKGIWQNLYQFPLIESKEELDTNKIKSHAHFLKLVKNSVYDLYLFNEKPIIHKLSHQHLVTKFWIVEIDKLKGQNVAFRKISKFPTSTLISNFISEFRPKVLS